MERSGQPVTMAVIRSLVLRTLRVVSVVQRSAPGRFYRVESSRSNVHTMEGREGIGDRAATWSSSDQSRLARSSPFSDTKSALAPYRARRAVAGSPVSMTTFVSASAILQDGARTAGLP